ncbi:hypothetical protein B7463_g12464, partial [Scytalidium lignicola]
MSAHIPVSSLSADENEYRLGVDVGGTFTDICVFTPTGETVRAKTLSTMHDQSIGVKNGINKVRELLRQKYGWDGEFSFIHHGTTVATNAILEGKGSITGLVVTDGHKDVLSVRRSQIPGGLGAWINFVPPAPTVPLERTVQCIERMSADGETVTPINEVALRKNLADLKRQNPEAVTISLLNAYKNNAHEKEVARIVGEILGPDVEIVCSSDVLPEAGEYERTVTAAANAVVKPVVKKYLAGLSKLLLPDSKTIRILKSDGGLTSIDLAGELPVQLLMSGPAGGVQGVVDVIAKQTKYKNLITLDMGGTSTDCALIANSAAALRRETVVDKLTVKAPSIDVRTVGAGGGSIAKFVELTSTLRVGPESAGATPGPACYGNGGKLPTVSDANFVLGYLPSKLLGGDFSLDIEAATAAVNDIANQMGMPIDQTAEGIINLVNETIYSALRLVSIEQGYDPTDFALVAFGGAGPLHANAIGILLGAWPVIIPPAPGVLCAQGDATTKLRHESSTSYIRLLSKVTSEDIRSVVQGLTRTSTAIMHAALSGFSDISLTLAYEVDLRYKGQALSLTIPFSAEELALEISTFTEILCSRFNGAHNQQFGFSLPSLELEFMRVGVIATDGSSSIELLHIEKTEDGDGSTPPESAIIDRRIITVEGKKLQAIFWDRRQLSRSGYKVTGPCVISEMDSNTLILPGFVGEIDDVGNILINFADGSNIVKHGVIQHTPESAAAFVKKSPLIPTLISSTLASIRNEMDTLMLRCAMSPAIREQQDEFNVITNARGQMLVGQFGSFIAAFLDMWKESNGIIEEGDVFVTNDVYQVGGAVSHLNDVIVLLPIHYKGKLVGWAANFGHLTNPSDVGGKVPGSMSIESATIFDDGVQIPVVKLYRKGHYNQDLVDVLCRNSRLPDWYRSDLTALVTACQTAATRVCELNERFGPEVYEAACEELLRRNKKAVGQLIQTQFSNEKSVFTDFVDDDGSGVGPFALKCTMERKGEKLRFDWTGTSPQSERSINYYLSPTMFKMFVGYYLLAVFDPYCVVNDGFHDLLEVDIPEGSLLKPVRPAALSCRTHLLGRTMDIVQALMGQKNPTYRAAAGFSDSPHFFYSGWKPNGEWYQLYQIGFGGIPARPAGDGLDCHCLFPAIKSIPTESIELNFPLRIEANEALADSGGPGFYRGGNAQRTLYRFLSRGEFSIHDDRWFTKPWGIDGGKPGQRSCKILYQYSIDPENPPKKVLPTLEVHRQLVTVEAAAKNYGVVVDPVDFSVKTIETDTLRAKMAATAPEKKLLYDRGGTLAELREGCLEETGLPVPKPQWEKDPYGAHVAVPYVQEWYKTMREKGDWDLE